MRWVSIRRAGKLGLAAVQPQRQYLGPSYPMTPHPRLRNYVTDVQVGQGCATGEMVQLVEPTIEQ
jgi:hypothetical protein